MKIIFVRHGHPNYKDDCLTPLGHQHAEAAAERLCGEKIDAFYASSCGRAVETAEHIAARFDAPVEKLDFMREIVWRPIDPQDTLPYNGHPWSITKDMVTEGATLTECNWKELELFSRSQVLASFDRVEKGLDAWLEQFGYFREGDYYRIKGGSNATILLASHAGSSTAALCHLMNLQPLVTFQTMEPDYTSITIVEFKGEDGKLIMPMLRMFNDARHIKGLTTQMVIGN